MQPLLPSPDVLPIPAPPVIFLVLLITVFTVHIVFMNFVFGGSLLGAFSYLMGRKNPAHLHLSKKLFKFMPAVIAITVNFGVAPLLFVQVLYGHLFYSSAILIASAWFSIIPLVILGYYGVYSLRFKWDEIRKFKTSVILGIALIFTVIPFIFVNNLSLLEKPAGWIAHYFKNPESGTFNWLDASMYPRYLHMLFGAVAVAGMWIMIIGMRGKTGDAGWSKWAAAYGKKVFIHATLANVIIGVWYLISHPNRVMMVFLGDNVHATACLVISIILTAAVLAVLYGVAEPERRKVTVYAAAGIVLTLIIVMNIMRQMLRAAYLEPYFTTERLLVEPQWLLFGIFAGVFLLVLVPSLFWLVRVSMRMKPAEEA